MRRYILVILISFIALGGIFLYQYLTFHDGKLHITFCDVGQGDAALIRTPAQQYILVDAGPDEKVIACLSKHMPLWHREINLAILTHPHLDHFLGFHYVLNTYKVKAFATEELSHDTAAFSMLMEELRDKRIEVQYVEAGDMWELSNGQTQVAVSIVGPTKEFLDRTSPNGKLGESGEFASLITKLSYGNFHLLLTGDTQAPQLSEAVQMIGAHITVLQSPHHGSATGLTAAILEALSPDLTVISVGKNNYGHPSLATLSLLKDIPVERTDKSGDVTLSTDGNTWTVH